MFVMKLFYFGHCSFLRPGQGNPLLSNLATPSIRSQGAIRSQRSSDYIRPCTWSHHQLVRWPRLPGASVALTPHCHQIDILPRTWNLFLVLSPLCPLGHLGPVRLSIFDSSFHCSILSHLLVAMGGIPVYRQNSATLDWEVVSSYDSDDCESRSDNMPIAPHGGALMLYDGSQYQRHGHVAHEYREHPGDVRFAQGEPAGGFAISRLSPYPPPGTVVSTSHVVTVPPIDTYNKTRENLQRGRGSPRPVPVMPELHSPLPTPPPPPYVHTPRPSRMSTPVPVPTPVLHHSHTDLYGAPVPPMRYNEYSPVPDGTGYPSRTSPVHEVDRHHCGETRSYYANEDRAYHMQPSPRYSTSAYQRSRSGDRTSSSRRPSRSPKRGSHTQAGNSNMLAVPIQPTYGW